METDKRSPAETDRGIGMQNENGRAEESYAAAVIAMIALIPFLFVWQYAILPGVRYDSAVELYRAGEF